MRYVVIPYGMFYCLFPKISSVDDGVPCRSNRINFIHKYLLSSHTVFLYFNFADKSLSVQEHDPSSTAARQLRQIDRHKRNNQRIMDALMQLGNQDLLVALMKRKAWNK